MKTQLPELTQDPRSRMWLYIHSIEEAKRFLKALFDNGESYHCEDDANGIINGQSGRELFTALEADRLNKIMGQIYAFAPTFDPCGYLLELEEPGRLLDRVTEAVNGVLEETQTARGLSGDISPYWAIRLDEKVKELAGLIEQICAPVPVRPIGNHTPEQTDAVYNLLAKTFPRLTFADASWHNDAADKIVIKDFKAGEDYKFTIWMPNAEEDLPEFCIETALPAEDSEFTHYPTIEAVIEFIKTI